MSGRLHHSHGGNILEADDLLFGEDDDQGLLEFQDSLDITISEVYPVLLSRIQSSNFAGWQRRVGLDEDLANQACSEFYAQCLAKRSLPDKALNYLVTIAKNLAGREYQAHLQREDLFAPLEGDFPGDKGLDECEGEHEIVDVRLEQDRKERLMVALASLTSRQREAFEIWSSDSDKTYAELGRKMGIGEDGFRKNFDRACEALELILSPKPSPNIDELSGH